MRELRYKNDRSYVTLALVLLPTLQSCMHRAFSFDFIVIFKSLKVTNLDEALTVINTLRLRYNCLGQQVVIYRKKHQQQVISSPSLFTKSKKGSEKVDFSSCALNEMGLFKWEYLSKLNKTAPPWLKFNRQSLKVLKFLQGIGRGRNENKVFQDILV